MHELRTYDDARRFWAALAQVGPGARLVVAGGSWIGVEVATAALARGAHVTVVEKASWLLPLLPPEVGRQVLKWCEGGGIRVRAADAVLGFEP